MMVWDIPHECIRSPKRSLAKIVAPSVRSSAGRPNELNAPRRRLITEEVSAKSTGLKDDLAASLVRN
jgi:hypothetical protein